MSRTVDVVPKDSGQTISLRADVVAAALASGYWLSSGACGLFRLADRDLDARFTGRDLDAAEQRGYERGLRDGRDAK
jgi:hypothetical protein